MDTTARDLFEKLKGQFKNLTLGKEDGTRTLIPGETSFFEFDYHNDESKLGSVVVSLVDEGSLKVYFATNIMDDADSESKDNWYGFLRGLRKFATQNMLNYEAKNISKQRLDKGDFEYLSKQNKTEEELTMESKLYGSRQKSYQDLNGAKLIVQHTKTVDEDKMGSRSRNIRAVYIENSDGERFKFENNYLPGARAMARHVSNGGYPRDEFGTHISEIMSEMSELRTFVRGVKGKDDYINEDAKDIIEKATGRYYGLKSTLESVSKQRGYTDYFENYEPTTFEVSEDDINDLKQKLTREVFDSKLENSLGAVGKAMKYNDQLQEKKSDGEYNDYPQWEKAAKREKADIIDGNIEDLDNKQEVTMYKIAMSGDEELGAWIQYQKDLDDPKVGQSVTIPGYGEFAAQAGIGDRGETDEREFIVPDSLELSPGGTPLSSMQYASKEDLLNLLMVDIASRAMDDEVANFAGKMADKVGSVGGTFGQDPKDPAYKADKKKAVALANMYIKQINKKDESVEEDEVPFEETTKTDPFDAYAESMDRIVEYDVALDEEPNEGNEFSGALAKAKMDGKEEFEVDGKTYKVKEEVDEAAKPDFLDLDGDGDKKEPMKKAAKDKEEKKEVKEGTWHIADDMSGLQELIASGPIPAKDAIDTISDYIGEDDLYDAIGDLEDMDPNADARDIIRDFLESGDIGYDTFAEGQMSDIEQEVQEMIQDGADNTEIMAKFPGIVDQEYLDDMRANSDEKQYDDYEMESQVEEGRMGFKDLDKLGRENASKVDNEARRRGSADMEPGDADRLRYQIAKEMGLVEATVKEDDDMAWLRKAAGIGSGARSNHGIREGEEGYQTTPRSLVAREMRKLQDIAIKD
jgi:Rod binding domain-containing protein